MNNKIKNIYKSSITNKTDYNLKSLFFYLILAVMRNSLSVLHHNYNAFLNYSSPKSTYSLNNNKVHKTQYIIYEAFYESPFACILRFHKRLGSLIR